jgi:hypothetical protein
VRRAMRLLRCIQVRERQSPAHNATRPNTRPKIPLAHHSISIAAHVARRVAQIAAQNSLRKPPAGQLFWPFAGAAAPVPGFGSCPQGCVASGKLVAYAARDRRSHQRVLQWPVRRATTRDTRVRAPTRRWHCVAT